MNQGLAKIFIHTVRFMVIHNQTPDYMHFKTAIRHETVLLTRDISISAYTEKSENITEYSFHVDIYVFKKFRRNVSIASVKK